MAAAAAKRKKDKSAEVAAIAAPAKPQSLEELRAELKEVEEQLEEYWRPEEEKKRLAARTRRDELRGKISLAEVKSIPDPAAFTDSDFESAGRKILVASIDVTGNHRVGDDAGEIERLARSIASIGLQSPIGVRSAGRGRFELIFGSRRLLAFKSLGLESIDARVYPETITPEEVELRRTAENIARREVGPAEQAVAVARMIEAVERTLQSDQSHSEGSKRLTRSIAEAGGVTAYVGQLLGRPVAWVRDHAYVTKLGGLAREFLIEGRLDLGHARELAKLGDPDEADDMAQYLGRTEDGTGGHSLESCRRQVAERLANLSRAPWRLDVAFPEHKAKDLPTCPCDHCPHNSKTNPGLFGVEADDKGAGICGIKACFKSRLEISEKRLADAVTVAVKRRKQAGPVPVAPPTIKPQTYERAIKKAEADPKPGPAAQGRRVELTPQEKLQNQIREWEDKVHKAVHERLKEIPGGFSMWMLIRHDLGKHLDRGYSDSALKKAIKAVGSKEVKALLDLLPAPTLAQLHAWEQKKKDVYDLDMHHFTTEAHEKVAQAIGAKVPPLPTLLSIEQPKPAADKKGNAPKRLIDQVDDDEGDGGDDE